MTDRLMGLETNGSNMSQSKRHQSKPWRRSPRDAAVMWTFLMVLASGGRAIAAQSGGETFASPQQATQTLAAAWRANQVSALLKIFGPAGRDLITSGDPVAELTTRKRLAAAYDQKHRIELQGAGEAILVLGKEDWPYPIPIVRSGSGWRFDVKAGLQQVLDRRIGANELHAIEASRAYVEAQRDFAARRRQIGEPEEYAQQIASSPRKHDGLFWPASAGEKPSPLGPLVAAAETSGYGPPPADNGGTTPFQGYYFRILSGQGERAPGGARNYLVKGRMTRGFALIAFPAKWGDSGVMTFLVNQNGIVFQKNLGPPTARLARRVTLYDPDRTWRVVYASGPGR